MTIQSQTSRARSERGSALVIALLATMLLTALGLTLVLMSNTETAISANYRNSQETLYAADAAVERVVQDLLLIPRWNDVLTGDASVAPACTGVTSFLPKSTTTSAFVDASTTVALPSSTQQINLLSATCNMQRATNNLDLWGPDDPAWRLFAWGRIDSILPDDRIDSTGYVAVWIADDPADGDGDPSSGHQWHLDAARRGLRPVGNTQGDRGHCGADGEHRNRARPDRAARPGRVEPARAQGGGTADGQGTHQHEDERHDWNAAMTRQTRTALLAAAAVLGWSITAFAQLDPLTLIKRVPPTVIIVVDTSLEMLQDGNGKFYDPGFYSRTADPIGVDSLERAGSGRDLPPDLRGVHLQRDRQIPDHEDHGCGGHVGSVEPGDGELAERLRRVLRAHAVSDCERRHRAGRRGEQQRHRAVGSRPTAAEEPGVALDTRRQRPQSGQQRL